ncbi:MAG: ABC transporter substrate-binding protein [Bacteroidia bacterium]|jgi:peptide/nickel transport system substrate-binding protein|nr:ABC transporter substrate-binding protein [Bacteroidia bacterium]
MRPFLWLVAISAFAASCSGDSTSGKPAEAKGGRFYGGVIRFNESEKIQTLFPAQLTDLASSHVASQIYDGLVNFDPFTLKVAPSIAEKWETDTSGTLYTFHLRKGVKFHDDACFADGKGRELTAEDVRYSFEQLCTKSASNQNFNSTFKGLLEGADAFYNAGASAKAGSLSGIKVVDAQTIQLKLVHSDISFLQLLANTSVCAIIPKEAVDKYGLKAHVGSGAFMLSAIAGDSSAITLVRNPGYFKTDKHGNQLPFLDTINITYVNNKSSELEFFREDKLDFVWGLNADAVKSFVPQVIAEFKDKYYLGHTAEMATQYYEFNTTRAPFNDRKVRMAFNYAINRNRIIDDVLGGEAYGPGINGICPPEIPGYKASEIKGYDFNPELARKLLAEAGYPGGKNFPNVRLVINSGGARNTNVASEIQNQLREVLNVNIEINNVSFEQKRLDEDYARSEMFRDGWSADYPSPKTFLLMFYGAEVPDSLSKPSFPNSTRYRNPEYDKLYESGRRAKTIEEANKYFLQAEQLMINDAPVMVLWYDENYLLMQNYVKNFSQNPLRLFSFSEVYIDRTPKRDGDKGNDKKPASGEAKTEEQEKK